MAQDIEHILNENSIKQNNQIIKIASTKSND